jgi:acyl carrier protein
MITRVEAAESIEKFIRDSFLIGENSTDLQNCESFLESGIIDSTGVLELIGFIQKRFGVEVHDNEIIPDNLDSISNIVRFLGTKGFAGL